MPRLYLIRHAEPAATWGDGADQPDPGLSERGRAQAEAARDTLLSLTEAERPTRVISSPLARCRETAAPTAAALGVPVEVDPAVGEVPTPAQLAPDARAPWLRRAFEGRWSEMDGDRDYLAWRQAVADALAGYAGCAVFSHYVAINAAVSHARSDDRVLVVRPDHAAILTFDVAYGRLTLVDEGRQAQTSVL